jgi:adenylate kinase
VGAYATFANGESVGVLNLVLLGPPGAGKGTQSALLIQRLGVPHISTGILLREAVRLKTEIGRRAKVRMETGKLIDDELVTKLIAERLAGSDTAGGFVLDGFPRTVPQAVALDQLLAATERKINRCIAIQVDENRIIDRLTERAAIERRADDHPSAIHSRLSDYRRTMNALMDYYGSRHLLAEVDGVGTVQEVSQRIWSVATSREADTASPFSFPHTSGCRSLRI